MCAASPLRSGAAGTTIGSCLTHRHSTYSLGIRYGYTVWVKIPTTSENQQHLKTWAWLQHSSWSRYPGGSPSLNEYGECGSAIHNFQQLSSIIEFEGKPCSICREQQSNDMWHITTHTADSPKHSAYEHQPGNFLNSALDDTTEDTASFCLDTNTWHNAFRTFRFRIT